ncbi:hypothetical protein [Protofrankia symbiont of Coriaria ruscifolia]|uniref:hypothetical protein n=1 Tax=Protofrankia symbiont of Coriaria ruscifolia TaxID=1306542 RepID=UPI0010411BBE|nr:hypothetical protein [Protofrankia symbiont of Coriaria ruscifolia]
MPLPGPVGAGLPVELDDSHIELEVVTPSAGVGEDSATAGGEETVEMAMGSPFGRNRLWAR